MDQHVTEMYSDFSVSPKKSNNKHHSRHRRKSINITLPSFMGTKKRLSKPRNETNEEYKGHPKVKAISFKFDLTKPTGPQNLHRFPIDFIIH